MVFEHEEFPAKLYVFLFGGLTANRYYVSSVNLKKSKVI